MRSAERQSLLRFVRARLGRVNLRVRRSLASAWVGLERRRGSRAEERQGVTVVTVTWNSLDFLRGFLEGVRAFSDRPVDILVVDNHSSDGTHEFLSQQTDVTVLTTPMNVGHGLGLDLAFIKARTTEVVALDVDAFPISKDWLDTVLKPLDEGAVVAGAYVQRAFIHPSFLALRRRDFIDLNLSFVPIGVRPKEGQRPRGLFMDVAEALCQTVAVSAGSKTLHRVPITSSHGENLVGSVYGDVVYHNFYSTQGRPDLVAAARRAWDGAIERYLPS